MGFAKSGGAAGWEQFNREAKSRCRFAADGEIGVRQCNLRLQPGGGRRSLPDFSPERACAYGIL